MSDLTIYQAKDGSMKLDVKLTDDTVWLTQTDIAHLFGVQVPAVSKHMTHIYNDGELEQKSTLSKMETVRKEGKRSVKRTVEFYNLDMILSIGYRVNSKKATQFRIWATTLLKQHLTKGYTMNPHRLEAAKIAELQSAVSLIRKAMDNKQLSLEESSGLLRIITEYAGTWALLDQYAKEALPSPGKQQSSRFVLEHGEVQSIVRALKKHLLRQRQATEDFGEERGVVLRELLSRHADSSQEHSSIEDRASSLLYDLIKEHPFKDGNKRIAAFLFIVFLTRTQYLTNYGGERKFNDNALVALVLLIAESDPKQKELIQKLTRNFVHG